MNQVKAGDTVKLGMLYERHKKVLFGYFYKLTNGDSYASEDLVHNVFYRVLKYSYGFKGDRSFLAWLFSIAHNVGQDYHKKNKNQIRIEDPLNYPGSLISNPNDTIRNEELKLLRMALKELKYEEREVLILGKIKNFSYKEVGEIINCNEVAVRVKIHRALQSLRKVYFEMAK